MIKKDFFSSHCGLLASLFIVIATIVIYWPVQNYDFVNFDDATYVTNNPHVQKGLTLKNFFWAFSVSDNLYGAHWHPLTWLSLMLDFELFGLHPGKFHLINLIIHTLNALLLYFVFRWMTGAAWRSAFIAMIFAIHPVNVESVAWIAERKNVLSTFFWMITILTYIFYVRRPSVRRYLIIFIPFILGLLSKSMLVSLPCVFLLLDFWPLERFDFLRNTKNFNLRNEFISFQESSVCKLVLEKIPFLLLSFIIIGISIITVNFSNQNFSGSTIPMNLRIANGLVSYIKYIGKIIWPIDLAVLYPFPSSIPAGHVFMSVLLIGGISLVTILLAKKFSFLLIGWLWYIGTLFPVIGLLQAGLWPEIADRWLYIPSIGLFVIVVWGGAELTAKWRYRKASIAVLATSVFLILMIITTKQLGYWKNSITLFEHAIMVTSDNHVAHNNLGVALSNRGESKEAIYHYFQSLRIKPDYFDAHYNLGNVLKNLGHTEEAIRQYSQAININPGSKKANMNMGVALMNYGYIDKAIQYYMKTLQIMPEYLEAHYNLGVAFYAAGRSEEAVKQYLTVLRINPDFAEAHNNLGIVLYNQGNIKKAIHHYKEALRIKPDYFDAQLNLSLSLIDEGDIDNAIVWLRKALKLKPFDLKLHNTLDMAISLKNQ